VKISQRVVGWADNDDGKDNRHSQPPPLPLPLPPPYGPHGALKDQAQLQSSPLWPRAGGPAATGWEGGNAPARDMPGHRRGYGGEAWEVPLNSSSRWRTWGEGECWASTAAGANATATVTPAQAGVGAGAGVALDTTGSGGHRGMTGGGGGTGWPLDGDSGAGG
ncbi:unnamed protein product, partial [Discosporangium mesarthrocarpum]